MEKKDVETLLKRIKYNYNEFRIDDYTMVEWYKELKDYALEDVMEKLDQHFRSEQYGNSIPKVYFLTKYLKKENEKNITKEYYVTCSYCKEKISFNDYEKHFDRCRSIDYINRQCIKYKGKEVNKEELLNLDDVSFEKYYNKVLQIVSNYTKRNSEKKIIGKILYNEDLDIRDIKSL